MKFARLLRATSADLPEMVSLLEVYKHLKKLVKTLPSAADNAESVKATPPQDAAATAAASVEQVSEELGPVALRLLSPGICTSSMGSGWTAKRASSSRCSGYWTRCAHGPVAWRLWSNPRKHPRVAFWGHAGVPEDIVTACVSKVHEKRIVGGNVMALES